MRAGIILFISIFLTGTLYGEEGLKLGGDIRSNFYVGLVYGDIYNYFNSNVVTIKGEAKPSDNVQGLFELRFRNENISDVKYLSDLKYKEKVEPVSLQLYESYVQFNSLFIKELDLKAGRQRIAWGTADGFNPTDNFSPLDLEDPLDFKNRLSVWAISTDLYLSPFDLSLVIQPIFEPSLLPNLNMITADSNPLLSQYKERLQEPEIVLPEFRAKNLIYGIRFKYSGERFDSSISYYHGYSQIPVVKDIKIETGGFALKTITPVLSYVEEDVIGLDFAVNAFDVGLFGEFACIFPEAIEPTYFVNGNELNKENKRAFGIPEGTLSVEDSPFLKFSVGMDYTFKGGYYINLQYVRGFFNELSLSALNNYIFAYMRKEFFDSSLQIQPAVGFEFDSDYDEKFGGEKLRGEKAYLLSMEMSYIPFNTGKITLGGAMVRGDKGSNLKMFEKLDQIYLKFIVNF